MIYGYPGGAGFNPGRYFNSNGCYPGWSSESGGSGFLSEGFSLILVLFILLLIVGSGFNDCKNSEPTGKSNKKKKRKRRKKACSC